MNRTDLLKRLLPGFLPLLVFIVVDEFLGTEAGIWFAIGFGIIELIFIYIKEKRFDKFIVADTILLSGMGGISILLENDIFFKLKPAIIELIFCVLIGFSAFSGKNILLKMSQRYMKGLDFNENAVNQFNKSLKVLFWILMLHVALIVFSAYQMGSEAWAFISGALFYILFGVFMVYEFIRNRLKNKRLKIEGLRNEEVLPLVDEKGNIIGKATRTVCHSGSKLLHPVVHLHVLNQSGQLFLQKRSLKKAIQPGKWDTAVGGHISLGESIDDSLIREAEEEIGLKGFKFHFITAYLWESSIEKELVYVFKTFDYHGIKLSSEEIDEGRFWTYHEIRKNLKKQVFTPNLEFELEKYGKLILSSVK